jgi:hypothetical protein
MSSWHNVQIMNRTANLASTISSQFQSWKIVFARVLCGLLHSLLTSPIIWREIRMIPPSFISFTPL